MVHGSTHPASERFINLPEATILHGRDRARVSKVARDARGIFFLFPPSIKEKPSTSSVGHSPRVARHRQPISRQQRPLRQRSRGSATRVNVFGHRLKSAAPCCAPVFCSSLPGEMIHIITHLGPAASTATAYARPNNIQTNIPCPALWRNSVFGSRTQTLWTLL